MAVIEKKQPESTANQYVEFDEFIDYQLRKTRTGIHQTDLISATVVLLCLFSAYLLVFAIFDQWVIPGGFQETSRIVLLGSMIVLSLAWCGWKIVYPWLQSINALYAARQIEQAHPELKGSLLTWVNLRQAGNAIPPSIQAALEKRTAHEISHANVDEAVDRTLLMRASYILLGLVVVTCLYTLLSPKKMSTTLWRALMPVSSVSAATRTEIRNVTPGDTEVLARDQVDVIAELGGQIPKEVTMYFTTADRRFVNQPVRMQKLDEELPRFQGRLTGDGGKGLFSDVSYRIEAGDARSAIYTIRVNQPPSAEVMEVSYEYPKYMGLSPSTQPGNTIDAWEGVYVTLRAKPNMPIKKGVVYCTDTETATPSAEEYPMTIRDDQLTARWQLRFREDGTFARYYHLQVWNERGQKNPLPTIYRIQIRPDLKPEAKIIYPEEEITVPARTVVPIAIAARDPDFLLRNVTLKLAHNGEELAFPGPLFSAPPEMAEFKSIYRLQLDQMPLKAGDQVTYWLEAEDNFEPFGKRQKNVTRTAQQVIHITEPVTPEAAQAEQKKQDQQLQQKIDEADPRDQPQRPEGAPEQEPQNKSDEQKENDPQQMPAQPQQPAQQDPQQPQQGTPQNGQDQQQDQQRPDGQMGETRQGGNQGQPNQQPQPGGDQGKPGEQSANQQGGPAQQSPRQNPGQPGQKNSNGTGGKDGAPQQAGQKQNSPRQDKAAEDQALEKLLEWNKDQEKQDPADSSQQQGNQNSDQSKTRQNGEKQSDSMQKQQTGPSESGNQEARESGAQQSGQKSGEEKSPRSQGEKNAEQINGGTGNQSGSDNQSSQSGKSSDGSQQGMKKDGASEPGESASADPRQPENLGKGDASDAAPNGMKNGPGQETKSEPGDSSEGKPEGDANSPENGTKSGSKSDAAPASGDSPQKSQMKQQGDRQTGNDQKSEKDGQSGEPGNAGPMPDQKESQNGQPPGGEQNSSGDKQTGMSQKQGADSPPGGKNDAGRNTEIPEQGAEGGMKKDSAGNQTQDSGKDGQPSESSGKSEMRKGSNPDSGTPSPMNGDSKPDPSGDQNPGANKEYAGQKMTRPQSEKSDVNGADAGQSGNESGEQSGNKGMKPNQTQTEKGQSDSANPADESGAEEGRAGEGDPSGKGSESMKSRQMDGEQGQSESGGKESGGKESGGKESGGKESGGKESGGKESGGKESGGKESGGKESGGKESGGKESGGKESGGKESGGKESGGKESGGKESGGKESGGKESGGKESGGKESGGKESGGKESGGKESGGKESGGKPGDKPGDQPGGTPGGNTGGGVSQGKAGESLGSGSGAPAGGDLTPEAADLNNKRKATELALKKLRDRMERGETPQELMDQLGYTQQDLERFMQRLEEQLADKGTDQSPESAAARRQFESLLKGIDYSSSGQMRSGGNRERKASESFGSGNRPVPPQYRRDSEAYKEKSSRQGTQN